MYTQPSGTTRANDFWIWPVDLAAEQTRARSLVIVSALFYLLGTALLLVQAPLHLSARIADAGITAVAFGIAASVLVVGKVVVNRARLS